MAKFLWPFTNLHELNLDWILEAIKSQETRMQDFVALNTIKYADPFQWDITSQYAQNTLVRGPQAGTAYLSTRPVPAGTQITNTEYWTPVFTLKNFLEPLKKAITLPQETIGAGASAEIPAKTVFWAGEQLVYAPDDIPVGTIIIPGTNCRPVTVVDLINEVGEVQETVTQQGQTIQQQGQTIQQQGQTIQQQGQTIQQQGQTIQQQGQQITDIEAKVKNTPWTTPEIYGAKGDGVTDDSAAFTQMFASGLSIMLTAGKTYLLKNPVTANNNVFMLGNGATINVDRAPIQSPNVQRLTFNGEYTHIENVNFTANASTSQWAADVAAMFAAYVINTKGRVCEVIGCTFTSIWGYAIRVENADTALVSDCVFDGVGGHYKQNNEFDMFGDCVWLGTTDKLQHAEITNCTMSGLVNGTTLSRCAVVLEFSTDRARYVSISGCTIANYDRTIHAENIQDAYISVAASQITNTNVFAFAISVGTGSTISFENCYIQTTGNDYSGTRGARGFAKMAFTNCSINYGGPLVWSLASQLPSIVFKNCYILANLRGSASASPILDSGTGHITFVNTWFEALTNQLGSLVPSGVNVLVNNSVLAAGAQSWSGSIATLYSICSDVTGIKDYKVASFTSAVP